MKGLRAQWAGQSVRQRASRVRAARRRRGNIPGVGTAHTGGFLGHRERSLAPAQSGPGYRAKEDAVSLLGYRRADIEARIGHASQLGGLKSYTLNDGKASGIRAVDIRTTQGDYVPLVV